MTGKTQKPCPGCGGTGWRDRDKVCPSCKANLEFAAEMAKPKPGEIVVNLYHAYLDDGLAISCSKPGKEAFLGAFKTLFLIVSRETGCRKSNQAKSLLPVHNSESYYGPEYTRYISEDTARALADLWATAGSMVREAVSMALDSGSNLLLQLASNKITIEQFNNASRRT